MSALAQTKIPSRMLCESAENCLLCGTAGRVLYQDLRDHLFGVEGTWKVRICPDPRCCLLWLDPMPLKSEIGKAYSNYYTHGSNHNEIENQSLHGLKQGAYRFYELLLHLTPIQRQRRQLKYMYLEQMTPGRLLEIGCGDGARLALFRDAGWTVEGVEVDSNAATVASRKHAVLVRKCDLLELQYPGGQFDAIILNHVIEHAHEPRVLVAECYRILKPGGTFVAVTPNAESFGHRQFEKYWRGLEPPRHLHLFTTRNLLHLTQDIPFHRREAWTSAANAEVICGWSLRLKRAQSSRQQGSVRVPTAIAVASLQIAAAFLHFLKPDSGEECILRLTK
jgi:SAM-dependent methyltransferase